MLSAHRALVLGLCVLGLAVSSTQAQSCGNFSTYPVLGGTACTSCDGSSSTCMSWNRTDSGYWNGSSSWLPFSANSGCNSQPTGNDTVVINNYEGNATVFLYPNTIVYAGVLEFGPGGYLYMDNLAIVEFGTPNTCAQPSSASHTPTARATTTISQAATTTARVATTTYVVPTTTFIAPTTTYTARATTSNVAPSSSVFATSSATASKVSTSAVPTPTASVTGCVNPSHTYLLNNATPVVNATLQFGVVLNFTETSPFPSNVTITQIICANNLTSSLTDQNRSLKTALLQFLPAMNFTRPVEVTFNYSDPEIDGVSSLLDVFYTREYPIIWETASTVGINLTMQTITVKMDHFSYVGAFNDTGSGQIEFSASSSSSSFIIGLAVALALLFLLLLCCLLLCLRRRRRRSERKRLDSVTTRMSGSSVGLTGVYGQNHQDEIPLNEILPYSISYNPDATLDSAPRSRRVDSIGKSFAHGNPSYQSQSGVTMEMENASYRPLGMTATHSSQAYASTGSGGMNDSNSYGTTSHGAHRADSSRTYNSTAYGNAGGGAAPPVPNPRRTDSITVMDNPGYSNLGVARTDSQSSRSVVNPAYSNVGVNRQDSFMSENLMYSNMAGSHGSSFSRENAAYGQVSSGLSMQYENDLYGSEYDIGGRNSSAIYATRSEISGASARPRKGTRNSTIGEYVSTAALARNMSTNSHKYGNRSKDIYFPFAIPKVEPKSIYEGEVDPEKITMLSIIGKGNFGNVVLGRFTTRDGTEVDVAVKQLTSTEVQEQYAFEMEVVMLEKTQHQHIVAAYGKVSYPREPLQWCIVLELGACNLKEYLNVTDTELEDRVNAAAQIASACYYLASQNIVHRDLAARNCVVFEDSSKLLVKLADFGLARELSADSLNRYKQSHASKLPPASAPEMLKGESTIKSDVYMFGFLLWEIFSMGADVPYGSPYFRELHGSPPRPLPRVACRSEIMNMMDACVSMDPRDRPNFNAIQQELDLSRNSTRA